MTTSSKSRQLLLVDDEASIRMILGRELQHQGMQVTTAEDVETARAALKAAPFDAILLDINMPGQDGTVLLREVRESPDSPPVIILTGHANVDLAVQCMRDGAADLLTKPCSVKQILLSIEKAVETQGLRDATHTLLTAPRGGGRTGRLIGRSPAMRQVCQLIDRVARTDEPVLVTGESGIGKELIAQELQSKSTRANKPFLTVNCAAVSDTLLESELFGHEKGAFSGAVDRRLGYFELAHEGTIFLDEIGDMPLPMQAKLLRVLQSGEVRRVGGSRTMIVNVRVIAATNKNLPSEIAEGRFREDLFHRINTIVIEVPPLRDRIEDLDGLVAHFLKEVCPAGPVPSFSDDALQVLRSYSWPGNVRELRNVVRRAVILREGEVLEVACLPSGLWREASSCPSGGRVVQLPVVSSAPMSTPLPLSSPPPEPPATLTLEEVERRHILAVLKANGGNKAVTARILGISSRTLYNKFEAWGMSPSD